MNIAQLPIEMLIKIFGYLPKYNDICLVNKLFYDVACKVNDRNVCLRIDDRIFKHNWIPSIIKSTKQISKLDMYLFSISDESATHRAMIQIVTKFGAFIKCLRISGAGVNINMSDFLDILSLIPNVEHLVCHNLCLRNERAVKQQRSFDDNDLNLHHLKILQFKGKHNVRKDKFLAVFVRLPVGVLRELELSTFNFSEAVILFKRQPKIKKLEMISFTCNATDSFSILDNLQLESLVINAHRPSDIATLLSKQMALRTLSLPSMHADDDLMNFVASHTTALEKLSIYLIAPPSPLSISNIGKMKCLKDMSVSFNIMAPTFQLESLASYPNGITSLFLCDDWLNVNLIEALAKSLTKLKNLRLVCDNGNNRAIINATLKNFNFIELLQVLGSDYNMYDELNDSDFFNPKLTELTIPYSESSWNKHLKKLIVDYPNLKKLRINYNPINSWKFKRILDGFTKLESLTLFGNAGSRLKVKDLNYLRGHKNNLQYVSLGGMSNEVVKELKERLSNVFNVIICHSESQCIMAVDRFVLDREKRLSKGEPLITSDFD